MLRFSIITFLLILLNPFNALANNLTLSLKQFSQKLEQYHFTKKDSFHNELNQVIVSYVQGVGAIYTFQYRQPLQVWQAIQKSEPQPQPVEFLSPVVDPRKAQVAFKELQIQAKNLSHQAYSLERQLSSIKKSIDQFTSEEKRQEKIRLLEKELELVSNEKELLKPKYDHAEVLAQQSSAIPYEDTSSNHSNYLDDIEQFIVDYSCNQTNLNQLGLPSDKLLFIFMATGNEQRLSEENSHFQDINLTLNMTDINACNSGEISQTELRNTLVKGYF